MSRNAAIFAALLLGFMLGALVPGVDAGTLRISDQRALVQLENEQSRVLNMVANDVRTLAAKLDADGGVTDTDYSAGLAIAPLTTSVSTAGR